MNFYALKANGPTSRDFFFTNIFNVTAWPFNFKLYAATKNADIKALQLNNVYLHDINSSHLEHRASAVYLQNEIIPDVYNRSIKQELYIPGKQTVQHVMFKYRKNKLKKLKYKFNHRHLHYVVKKRNKNKALERKWFKYFFCNYTELHRFLDRC